MRVIGGACKGRRLAGFSDSKIRPTSDFVRKAIFDRLPYDLSGSRVLDLWAGTGALGIEALSRGATFTVFVDTGSAHLIRKNLELCRFLNNWEIIRQNVDAGVKSLFKRQIIFDYILMDPPYQETDSIARLLQILHHYPVYSKETLIFAEHFKKAAFAPPAAFEILDTRKYGDTCITLLKPKPEKP